MKDHTPGNRASSITRVHWTSWLSCALSLLLAPVFPLLVIVAYHAPLLNLLVDFVPFYVLVLVYAVVALRISSRPPWRAGRWLALLAVVLPVIDLILYVPFIVYLSYFWHPGHLVF